MTTDNTDIQSMLEQRESTYGKFIDQARLSQRLKEEMRNHPNWYHLYEFQREALDMIQHKIARALNGDKDYLDNWIDIAGYTQLVINQMNEYAKQDSKCTVARKEV